MNISEWLKKSIIILKESSIETAELDANVLLADILDRDKSWIHAHDDFILQERIARLLDAQIQRRRSHEPLAYIRGFNEFYGREFQVNSSVLVPRPESESIIDLFKELELPTNALVADVGCGSGALGIAAKLERPDIRIYFLDIDADVFVITKSNARKYHLKSQQYYTGDLMEAWREEYDVLLCNLPYVPLDYPVNEAAQHEPKIALYSGDDGLNHYRRLFTQLATHKYGCPIVITESLLDQHEALCMIAQSNGWSLVEHDGLAQVFAKN